MPFLSQCYNGLIVTDLDQSQITLIFLNVRILEDTNII